MASIGARHRRSENTTQNRHPVGRFTALSTWLKPRQCIHKMPFPLNYKHSQRTVLKHKNLKIFSPRSRKVRCRVEKPVEVPQPSDCETGSGKAAPRPPDTIPESKLKNLSVFNFNSSQDSGSSFPQRATNDEKRRRQLRQEMVVSGSLQPGVGKNQRHVKKQSRRSRCRGWRRSTGSGALVEKEMSERKESRSYTSLSQLDKLSAKHLKQNEKSTTKPVLFSHPKHTPKRSCAEEKNLSQSTPPKNKASPGQGRCQTERVPLPALPTMLTAPDRRTTTSSPCSPAPLGKTSPGRVSQSSPAVVKRTHKGTPLHLAAIKGDVENVKELLDQGADPNLKDNAGWTPLHEAYNLGHQCVVEALVRRGVLLNTPGSENDCPLLDAEHWASQSVLNMFGLRPVDYDVNQAILQSASEGPNSPLSPPPNLSKASDGVTRMEQVVVLGSKLSQHNQLAKLGIPLGGKRADAFSCSVTYVVVPDGPMPTTLFSLLGLLNGCWVLNFSCLRPKWHPFPCLLLWLILPELQLGRGVPLDRWLDGLSDHEAEGPQHSCVNRHSLEAARDELLQVVREVGGQILARHPKPDSDVTQTLSTAAYHALVGLDALCTQYIIYDPQSPYRPPRVKLGRVWSAPSTWVVICISAFQLLSVPEP
ncbi:LOW QUALITY PROTEIN: BRCA1-associated RING domain protein 1 [Salvelinus alpinus]